MKMRKNTFFSMVILFIICMGAITYLLFREIDVNTTSVNRAINITDAEYNKIKSFTFTRHKEFIKMCTIDY